jgi:hypothetical protein
MKRSEDKRRTSCERKEEKGTETKEKEEQGTKQVQH